MQTRISLPTMDATVALAQRIAPKLGAGDVLGLKGTLGTGKTAFARALIQTILDVPVEVASPTFTLLQTYPAPFGEIWHYDLYRVEEESALRELGLEEAWQHLVLIEWPEHAGNTPIPFTAMLEFTLAADGSRDVTIYSEKEWV